MSNKRSNRGRPKKLLASSLQPNSLAILPTLPAAPIFPIKKKPNAANRILHTEYHLVSEGTNPSLLDFIERDFKKIYDATFDAGTVSDPLLISMMTKPYSWRVAFNSDASLKKKRSEYELPEHGATILVMVMNVVPVVLTVNQFGGDRAYLLTAATVFQHAEMFDTEEMAFDADAVHNYLNNPECDWDNDFVVVDAKGNTNMLAIVLAHYCFLWKLMKGEPLPHPEISVPPAALPAVRFQVYTVIKEILLSGISSLKSLSPICYGSIASLIVDEPSQKRTKQDAITAILDSSILVKNKTVSRCRKLLANVEARLELLPAPFDAALPAPFVAALPAPFVAALPAPFAAALPAPFDAALPAPFDAALPAPFAAALPLPFAAALPAPFAAALPAPFAAVLPLPFAAAFPPVVEVIQSSSPYWFDHDATRVFLHDQVSTLVPGTVTENLSLYPLFDFTFTN